jgi:peptidoglycan hydrolase-like protein with peptidoglycan-binding domain
MARLKGSVGEAAANSRPDVKYVQYLLTDWRLSIGGRPLAIDGIVGPLTSSAIREFQRARSGVVDGRVDPNGRTIRWLEYCHLSRIASRIKPLDYLGKQSMTPPPFGTLTIDVQAGRYLDGLRRSYG